ncbi:hypothetical protein EVAR_3299_1 [Eumeta japonica]|uniref:Uncharacterized protein n=1 Tax=Eumeta variegata TaxID=151549 RepID=A0A4C1SV04_EUMVA|nr:hypothetical protein EVAR_3299_1 [Eumeta japonica]
MRGLRSRLAAILIFPIKRAPRQGYCVSGRYACSRAAAARARGARPGRAGQGRPACARFTYLSLSARSGAQSVAAADGSLPLNDDSRPFFTTVRCVRIVVICPLDCLCIRFLIES